MGGPRSPIEITIGYRSGALVVASISEVAEIASCRCERCGGRKLVKLTDLRRRHVRSCGCGRSAAGRARAKDETGKVHGNLEVLGRAGSTRKKQAALWRVRCRRCRWTGAVRGQSLRSGNSTSCGCSRSAPKRCASEEATPILCACARPGGTEAQASARRLACATERAARLRTPCRCACHAPGALVWDRNGSRLRVPGGKAA